jgi:hypothetical protein
VADYRQASVAPFPGIAAGGSAGPRAEGRAADGTLAPETMTAEDRTRVADRRGVGTSRSLQSLGLAVAASAGVAVLVLLRHPRVAGVLALIGALCLVAGTAAARRSGIPRERITELVADRLFDASVLLPLAWVARLGSPRVAALALVGFGATFVASYERARGQALGMAVSETVPYRVVRVSLLTLALLLGPTELFLWAVVVVTAAAVVVRAWNVRLQVGRS